MKLNNFVRIVLAMQWILGVSIALNGRPSTCCENISKVRVNITRIEKYATEIPICPLKAVRFTLKSGKVLCSDPRDPWAKSAIEKLDNGSSTTAPNTPPSSTSTSLSETTTSTSSGTTAEGTVSMMMPKGTSTTWKQSPFISSIFTEQPPSIQTIKMTTATPSITDFKTTSTTTKSPVSTIPPKGTSTTWKSTTYITNYSAKPLPRSTRMSTFTPETKTTSMTRITENRVTPPKESSTTWNATTNTTVKPPRTNKSMPNQTITRQNVTANTLGPKIKATSMAGTTKNRVTMTTAKGTSTTTATTRIKRCLTSVPRKLDNHKGNNLPWTVRRLKKKSKQGLRRVQLNKDCIEA